MKEGVISPQPNKLGGLGFSVRVFLSIDDCSISTNELHLPDVLVAVKCLYRVQLLAQAQLPAWRTRVLYGLTHLLQTSVPGRVRPARSTRLLLVQLWEFAMADLASLPQQGTAQGEADKVADT